MIKNQEMDKQWECEQCGNSLESKIEPNECPCGSESIEAREQLSMMEKMMKDYLADDNQGES